MCVGVCTTGVVMQIRRELEQHSLYLHLEHIKRFNNIGSGESPDCVEMIRHNKEDEAGNGG